MPSCLRNCNLGLGSDIINGSNNFFKYQTTIPIAWSQTKEFSALFIPDQRNSLRDIIQNAQIRTNPTRNLNQDFFIHRPQCELFGTKIV